MKSKLLYIIACVFAAFAMSSCDDDSTAGMTRITYYPVLTLDGASTLYLHRGDAFTEPGYSAELNGEDVTGDVNVSSNVDTSKSGVFSVVYSITNADGFASTASRKVIVTNPADPVEGVYLTDANSYRDIGGTQVAYGKSFQILVFAKGGGVYAVDDLLGGWYCQRAGYGTNYAMVGTITVDDAGVVELGDSYINGWGDSLVKWSEGQFDADAGTLKWCAEYVQDMKFFVTMYKQ